MALKPQRPHADIERTYGGGKKPLASRQPLPAEHALPEPALTPSQTEGETEDEADDLVATPVQSETERDGASGTEPGLASKAMPRKGSVQSTSTSDGRSERATPAFPPAQRQATLHDLTNRYFRKPVVVFSRIDMFR